jgi:predicted CopG family antitoxin
MGTTTISISEDVRTQLLKVEAELQARTGEKVDFNEVVRYLLSRVARDEQLFKQACAPVDVDASRVRKELRRGRAEDQGREDAFEAKHA